MSGKFDHLKNPHEGDPCAYCELPSGVTDNEECLGVLLVKVRDIRAEFSTVLSQLDFFEKRAKAMTKIYAELLDISGEVLKIEGAKATSTPPKKPRVYWDAKELEIYSREHPEIRQFREERWSKPSVRIVTNE